MIDLNFTNKNKPNFFMKWKLAYLYAVRIQKNVAIKKPPEKSGGFLIFL
jgi:hypothetical protein